MHALDAPRRVASHRRALMLAAIGAIVAVAAVALLTGAAGTPQPREPVPSLSHLLSVAPPAGDERIPAGARFVSPGGSDRNPGTRRRPWRTLEAALERLQPGATVVVLRGTYGARGRTINARRNGTAKAPISVTGPPHGRRPVIRGFVRMAGSHLRFSRLVFDGPTGRVQPTRRDNPRGEQVVVAITGDDVTISGSVVRDSAWHAGIYVDGSEGARLVRNHVYANGNRSDRSHANVDHGIYWARGSGLVANNVIERNVARGIQLYPRANGVLVAHNTVVDNGKAGIQVGDGATKNVIASNIVAFNDGSGIRSSDLRLSGNHVINNLVWGNGEGNIGPETHGLRVSRTTEADPRLDSATYCPRPGSPAIDRGLFEYAPADDYHGERRRRRAADLGACEVAAR
jgi:hypothetical protein